MGIWATLGEVGQAKALAERQQKQDAIEKAYLGIQQQYAKTNQERTNIEKTREERLTKEAGMPRYLGHVVAPDGSLVYGMQDPKTGQVNYTKLPYSLDIAESTKAIDAALDAITDPGVRNTARAAVASHMLQNDVKGARAMADWFLKSQMPQKETVTDTKTHTDPFTGDVTSHKITQKVPAKVTTKGDVQAPPKTGMGDTTTAKPKTPPLLMKPKGAPSNTAAPLSPKAREAFIIKNGWTDIAPSPAFFDENGKITVPRKLWPYIDQMAENVANGATKLPGMTPKNYQLIAVVSARAMEKGWNGGPPPTTSMRDAAGWARRALPHIAETRALISQLDQMGALGPIAGRVNEFMTGKVGTDLTNGPNGPLYIKLRDNMTLLNTALMRQHVGARGGQRLLEHFTDLWQPGRMDAATMNAALDVMENFMSNYATLDQIRTPQGGAAAPTTTPPPSQPGQVITVTPEDLR